MAVLPVALPEAQHGLITTEQLLAAGFDRNKVRWLTRSERLIRLSPRVMRLAGAPETSAQAVLAAVLDAGPGSALSHSAALAWWGLPGFQLDDPHVTHPRDGVHRTARMAHRVHDVVVLPHHHVRVLEGVPIVVPARALFDLAGQRGVHEKRVERAIDNAWAKRLVSGRSLHNMLDELGQRGRPGIRLMRKLLKERGPDYVPPASGLENRTAQILQEAGEPPLRRQANVGDETGWIGRVDFIDDVLPFILEVQSERFHSSLLDQQSDKERLARLAAAGFVVAEVTDTDVWHRKHRVVDAVRRGRHEARLRSRR